MKEHYSVIVVGAGSIGMATGYYLGKKGVDTLLIDAFNPPHGKGSHHGETRLIRHAAGEGRQYVPLALRAQDLWYQLEKEIGKTLFYPTGTLMVGEEGAPFINETIKSANEFSLPLEKLTAKEIQKRWPRFSVPDYFTGYFEPSSGALLNEECIKAYRQLSESYPVTLQTNANVISINSFNDVAIVKTKNKTYYADKVIVSAGAWTGELLRSLDLPLQTVRKTFGWFETNDTSFQPPMLPCFYFNLDDQKYYGFPDINKNGIKIGRNDSERDIDPHYMKQDFGKYTSDKDDLKYFVEKFIPKATKKFKCGKACMITNTPDKNFIIDIHPKLTNVIIAAGFSGHGFKYSSVIGEILSQLVIDGHTTHDISEFSITRKELTSFLG
ncbi:N-methyl-L-tryptophan oxidase [Virgibacillus halotolerans]|uniref:N-methyl-L-tryptophan oxidase n=1 Tax=Virgibacillus halotolerans TaxID=1071053 RepID=UPI0019613497|nr:N-methyl-L-tryptophan oxidase [Virgibacillus halotolerans]MBM7599250.1 N-methyl-L-tryptophan oxidase [Virgibacillus halotolerans]